MKFDASGNGQAVIRFLPAKTDDALPFAILVNHGFKKNGKWYIETCSSTHGDYDSCPVCQYISKNDLYNTNKTEYSQLKRKTSYWANILVVKDPQAPEYRHDSPDCGGLHLSIMQNIEPTYPHPQSPEYRHDSPDCGD